MGCIETKSEDEDYDEERPNPWITGHRRNDYQEEGDLNNDEEEFKDFEELGSKNIN